MWYCLSTIFGVRYLVEPYSLYPECSDTGVKIFWYPSMRGQNFVSGIVRLHHLTTLFMVAFLFLLAIVLHFTLAISQLFDRNKRLTQELACLRFELEELRRN